MENASDRQVNLQIGRNININIPIGGVGIHFGKETMVFNELPSHIIATLVKHLVFLNLYPRKPLAQCFNSVFSTP